MHQRSAISALGLALVLGTIGCSGQGAPVTGDTLLPGAGGDAKADGEAADPAENQEILAALHAQLDERVGQPNQYQVSWIRVGGVFAFVQATIAGQDGAEIDWTQSAYAADLEEGFFDGPHLEALLIKGDEGWTVAQASVGATDVWWVGLPFEYSTPCSIFPFEGDFCVNPTTPVPGTEARLAVIRAIHDDFLDPELHDQPNELVVSWMLAGGGYAFVQATVRGVDGAELDWQDSEYADDIEEGLFDGPTVNAFLQLDDAGDTWTVLEYSVGPTDVAWWGTWDRFENVPCSLFPVVQCE